MIKILNVYFLQLCNEMFYEFLDYLGFSKFAIINWNSNLTLKHLCEVTLSHRVAVKKGTSERVGENSGWTVGPTLSSHCTRPLNSVYS